MDVLCPGINLFTAVHSAPRFRHASLGDLMAKPQARSSLAERIAYYCLLAIPVAVPLALAKVPIAGQPFLTATGSTIPKFFTLSILVGTSAIAWTIALIRGETELRHARPIWWLLAFLGLTGLSTATALNRSIAAFGEPTQMLGLLTFLLGGTVCFLATQLVTGPQRMREVARAAVIGGFAVAAIGVLQYLQLDPFVQNKLTGADEWINLRGASTIGNPDSAGTYLVFPFILSVALSLSESSKRWRVAAGISSVLIASGIFITLTRGAWIAAVVGLGILGFAYSRAGGRLTRAMKIAGGGAVLLLGLVAWDWGPELVKRFTELTHSSAAGGGRILLWSEAVRVITAHPLLGVGPDSYRYGWYPLRSLASVGLQGSGTITNDPHNLALLFGATLGVPALIAAVGLLVATLAQGAKNAFTDSGDPDRLVFLGWWTALASFAVAMFVSFNTIPAATALFLCLGVLGAASAKRVSWTPVATRVLAGGIGAASAMVMLVAALSLAADATLLRAQTSQSLTLADQAVALAPWNYDARVTATYLSGLPAVLAVQAGDANATPLVEEADRASAALVEWNPYSITGYSLRSTLLLELGTKLGDAYLTKAADAADAGLAVSPTSVELAVLKARALVALGRPSDAAAALEKTWDTDPTLSDPGVLYAETLIGLGRSDTARPVVATLRERFADDPEVQRVAALLGN